jgi:uncharacterized membrane protein
MIAFETDVRIDRPIEEVFAYVSDPLNFPRWNSAVQAVRRTSADENGAASTYLMERELPSRRASSRSARSPARRRSSTATGSLRRMARQSSNSTPRSSYRVRQPSCRSWPGAQSRTASMTTSQR